MHHHTSMGDFTFLESLPGSFNGMSTGESAGQGRVQVDDAVGKVFDKGQTEDAHPTSQDDQIRFILRDKIRQFSIVRFTVGIFIFWFDHGWNARGPGAFQSEGFFGIGNHGFDLGSKYVSPYGIDECLKVAAVA